MITKLLSATAYITVNKHLIKIIGLEGAVLLGELISEYNYWVNRQELENDYFYSTIENVENNTGLSGFQQRKTIKQLQELNIIDVQLKGLPAKRYIKINELQVLKLFDKEALNNLSTSCEEIKQLDVKKVDGNNNNIIRINNNNKKNNNPDLIFDSDINKCFSIYEEKCPKLIKLIGCERRNKELLSLLNDVLNDIDRDLKQFETLCVKANELEKIVDKRIDLKTLLRNYIGILNGKYKQKGILDGLNFGDDDDE